jgi:hypothetical protein
VDRLRAARLGAERFVVLGGLRLGSTVFFAALRFAAFLACRFSAIASRTRLNAVAAGKRVATLGGDGRFDRARESCDLDRT